MFTTVLVPTDGSPGAETALSHAIELAQSYGAAVHALYIVEIGVEPASLEQAERDELRKPSERRGREATIRVTDRAESLKLKAARRSIRSSSGRPMSESRQRTRFATALPTRRSSRTPTKRTLTSRSSAPRTDPATIDGCSAAWPSASLEWPNGP